MGAGMILVPAGEFPMGEGDDMHPVYVAAYHIAKFPVTNYEYQVFVDAARQRPPAHWPEGRCHPVLSDHPVVNVSWHQALAYCRWLTDATGLRYRLATEAEWEKAARGTDARTYPWGNEFDETRCNSWEGWIGRTTPVDYFPTGASPYGVMDLVGNVWEWCSSLYAEHPYRVDDGREDLTADGWRVLRGGSWYDTDWGARPARRLSGQPDHASHNTGFRIVREF